MGAAQETPPRLEIVYGLEDRSTARRHCPLTERKSSTSVASSS